ncbi:hypothetical protein CYMTET_6716 [Cymbomonas tetramitiformis]|uniref:Uncharacterized protein n=1 Tax=Cymbomonas tetramitiformis TaxID=36881 RepID=A0AAE0GWI3_9CHLO|nr:hypothetical protein CYMTET_39259 [Cymbomonas tetramitiformis]KAK3285684.1 hypothetical protein CYMTET_6716 [Cymbomonas tetramitiformis]|eukprot:gene5316-6460_t
MANSSKTDMRSRGGATAATLLMLLIMMCSDYGAGICGAQQSTTPISRDVAVERALRVIERFNPLISQLKFPCDDAFQLHDSCVDIIEKVPELLASAVHGESFTQVGQSTFSQLSEICTACDTQTLVSALKNLRATYPASAADDTCDGAFTSLGSFGPETLEVLLIGMCQKNEAQEYCMSPNILPAAIDATGIATALASPDVQEALSSPNPSPLALMRYFNLREICQGTPSEYSLRSIACPNDFLACQVFIDHFTT